VADPRLSAGGSLAEAARPTFLFDFASPECWLAAEGINHELPVVPAWVPVRLRAATESAPRFSSETELAHLERRAAAQRLPLPQLPDPWPADLDLALRAATFAAASGRVVAFSLAALRQAFAAGRDLSEIDNVLIAAAACELHPRAVLKGVGSRSVEKRLREASARAEASGVSCLPALLVEGRAFSGASTLEEASAVLDPDGR
jgi:2-hydroxychromene-2-carboxylate isomerase